VLYPFSGKFGSIRFYPLSVYADVDDPFRFCLRHYLEASPFIII